MYNYQRIQSFEQTFLFHPVKSSNLFIKLRRRADDRQLHLQPETAWTQQSRGTDSMKMFNFKWYECLLHLSDCFLIKMFWAKV